MKKKHHLLFGALVLLFVACSSDAEHISVPASFDANCPITPTVSVDGHASRTGSVGSLSAFAASLIRIDQGEDKFYPATYSNLSLSQPFKVSVTAGGQINFAVKDKQYYLADGRNTKLIAMHPQIDPAQFNLRGTVTYGIDGATDIMATAFVESNKSSAQPELIFRHLLSRVELRLYAETTAAIDVWGKVTAITVKRQVSKGELVLPAPNVTERPYLSLSGFDRADLSVTQLNGSVAGELTVTATAKADADLFGYCIIPPTTTEVNQKLQIHTQNGGDVEVTIPACIYEAGKHYVISLRLVESEILPSLAVTEWQEGGEKDAEV